MRERHEAGYPRNAWYALASSSEVTREPLGTRALDLPVVLFRTTDGTVVALGDRDAHRPYPLSLGRVDGDTIVSGYSGFAYDRTGACVRVPSQEQVPYGARVPSYPVREAGDLVWVWFGEPSLADRRPPRPTSWLTDPAWETFGGQWETAANVRLLHDNFADITHVAVVDPVISPPVLAGVAPALEVELTETTVVFQRGWPAAPMPPWQASVSGSSATTSYPQREEGAFLVSRPVGRPVGGPAARRRGRPAGLPLHPCGDAGGRPPHPPPLAGQPQLRAGSRGERGPAPDLRGLLP